ncbi:hypothetical protein E1A91_D03G098100v1 [Gossypium mustelinum]|uniref:WAT1-related protein n=1 Tax=Gossypium mustelinum TaxID=34275 RepID=A0A5D2VKT9_GOSMU|nr:hypothetical protein E1A91_D03G098100v1 [Gossypium mustelinum]
MDEQLMDHFDAKLCNHWSSNNWLIGALFIVAASLSLSAKIVGQVVVLKGYPSEITLVSFYCLFGSIQSALVTFS